MVKRVLAFLLGSVLILFGLLAFIGFAADFSSNESQSEYVISIILFLVVGLLPILGGFFFCKWSIQSEKNKRTNYEKLENTILQIAEERHGRLTAVELAMDTKLTLEEAKEILEKWAHDGYVTIKVSEGGALIYDFTGITSERERRSAKGVSEY